MKNKYALGSPKRFGHNWKKVVSLVFDFKIIRH